MMIRKINSFECQPWKYANRQKNNYGDIEELVLSIKRHSQLQPGLVRLHPNSHGNIKYEVIFGCRRLKACEQLGIPFLAMIDADLSDQAAAGFQYDENKKRSDSSPYSDALLYRRMLDENLFATERELARVLGISKSALSDLLSFTKIPQPIINLIPDVHSVSKNIAVKVSRIVNANPDNYNVMLALAPEIGRSITSPQKLEKYFSDKKSSMGNIENETKVFLDKFGDKIFSLGFSASGTPTIKIEKGRACNLDTQAFAEYIKAYFD